MPNRSQGFEKLWQGKFLSLFSLRGEKMTFGFGLLPNVLKVTKTVECLHCGVQTPTPSELQGKPHGEMFCTHCERSFTVFFWMMAER